MHDVLARPLPPARPRKRAIATAVGFDVVAVVAFATVGRSSHDSSLDVAGVLGTAWPFLVALAVGWLVLRAHKRPFAVWPTGVALWGITWGLGMALRAGTGGGTALPFVLVALGALGVLLVGWRFLARFTSSARSTYPGLSQH